MLAVVGQRGGFSCGRIRAGVCVGEVTRRAAGARDAGTAGGARGEEAAAGAGDGAAEGGVAAAEGDEARVEGGGGGALAGDAAAEGGGAGHLGLVPAELHPAQRCHLGMAAAHAGRVDFALGLVEE
jgi:hypothetical protein